MSRGTSLDGFYQERILTLTQSTFLRFEQQAPGACWHASDRVVLPVSLVPLRVSLRSAPLEENLRKVQPLHVLL